jgi:arsenate reductase (thioredoxin)
MHEEGVDISKGHPKAVAQFLGESFDFVTTVCDDADKNCLNFRGEVGQCRHRLSRSAKATGTDDRKMTVFRTVRDDIQKRFGDYFETEIKKRL